MIRKGGAKEYSEQVHLFATKWIEKFRDQKNLEVNEENTSVAG